MPSAASRSSSCGWLVTGCLPISRAIACWRCSFKLIVIARSGQDPVGVMLSEPGVTSRRVQNAPHGRTPSRKASSGRALCRRLWPCWNTTLARTVDDVGRHLQPAVRRQAVHEAGAGRRASISAASTVKPSNACLRSCFLGLLPHRHPRVGVHERRRRRRRRADRSDGSTVAEQLEPLALGVVPLVAGRAAEAHRRPEQHARLGERTGDVVVVADVGDACVRRAARRPAPS